MDCILNNLSALHSFAASVVLSLAVQHYYNKICQLTIICRETAVNRELINKCKSLTQYRPTPFYLLDYYGHVHTIAFSLIRQVFNRRLLIDRELLKLTDGGTVGLDWVISKGVSNLEKRPLVILVRRYSMGVSCTFLLNF